MVDTGNSHKSIHKINGYRFLGSLQLFLHENQLNFNTVGIYPILK